MSYTIMLEYPQFMWNKLLWLLSLFLFPLLLFSNRQSYYRLAILCCMIASTPFRWRSCKKMPHPHWAYTIHLAVSTCSPTYWPFLMCYVIHLFFQILVHLLVFSIFSGSASTFTLEAIFPPIYLQGKSSFLPFLAFPKDVQIRKNWSVGYPGLKLQCLESTWGRTLLLGKMSIWKEKLKHTVHLVEATTKKVANIWSFKALSR